MSDQTDDTFTTLREAMVREQLEARGIIDERILKTMGSLPRHRFVPVDMRREAYADHPIALGPDQTVSQPFIVALMLQELALQPSHSVLEIGTGSGYQAAILSELAGAVYTIERDKKLAADSKALLQELGFKKIKVLDGDGFEGWREHAPYDRIILSAAPETVPRELVSQLKLGGKMILPLGVEDQCLVLVEKTAQGLHSVDLGTVYFVKMKQDTDSNWHH